MAWGTQVEKAAEKPRKSLLQGWNDMNEWLAPRLGTSTGNLGDGSGTPDNAGNIDFAQNPGVYQPEFGPGESPQPSFQDQIRAFAQNFDVKNPEEVRELQGMLLGSDTYGADEMGGIDGIFGPKTEAVYRNALNKPRNEYERTHNMSPEDVNQYHEQNQEYDEGPGTGGWWNRLINPVP